jgi:hypothetical protein
MSELNDLLTRFKQEDAGSVPGFDVPHANNDLLTRYKQEDAVLNAFATAHKTNPDEYAKLRKTAIDAGMTPEQVDMFPEEAERRARYDEAVRLAQESPKTAKWVATGDNAKLAHDDTENMGMIEQVLRNTGSAAVSGLRSASAGAVGLARAPFELAAPLLDPLTGTILPENPLRRTAAGLAEYQQGIAGRAKAEMPQGDDVFSSGFYSGIASLSRNLAALPMAFLPGGQEAALGAMVAPVFGESYGQGRDNGMSPVASTVFGGSQAAIEYVTEKIPLGKLLGDLKQGTPFLKTLAHNMAREIPGEQAATVLQDLNEWAVLNPDKPFAEYLKERPNAAAQTLIATMVGTGGQVTLMEGVSRAVGYAENRAMKAQQAERGAAFVENLNKLAASDKLLQRSPDDFQSFVAAAAEDGPVDTVFIDGKFLMQSGMAPQLAEMSPAVRDQLDRAILTGGDIAIPVAEYAARIAPTELAPQLLDHLKTEPDGFTRAEAQDYMQNQGAELQAEVERILTDRQDADTFRASQDVVKQDILGQLNTAGRFTPQVNEAYATLASAYSAVRAAQLGMTPEAFHQQRGMKVQGEAVTGQQFSQGVTLDAVRQQWDAAGIKHAISEKTGAITLSQIVVPESDRGAGKGTAAMQALVDYADRTWQRVMLTPSSDFGGNKKRLTEFYKRFGFVENKGKNKDFSTMERMIREPKPVDQFNPADPNILNQSASQDGAVALRALADEGNNQAIVAQALVDRAGFGPKQFADVLEGAALGAQPDGLVGVPAFAAMLSHMRAAVLDDAKVLDAIVGSVPVDMVNNLAGSESAAKVLLHDEAMNEDSPAFNADLMVANGVDTSNPVGLLVREAALAAAKVASVTLNNGRESSEAGAAILAGNGNSFSQSARLPRAAFHPSTNTITLLDNADLTSFLHESAHYFFESDIQLASELLGKPDLTPGEQQIVDDVSRLLTWHGIQGDVTEQLRQWHTMDFEEQRSHHERTAESFEAYLFSGRAPSLELQPVFQRFAAWMVNVYKSLKDFLTRNPEAGKLNDEVRSVFDRMIATREEIALAEQARSMMPLFSDPAKSGMSPEDYAKYQAQGIDATNAAIQDLQAKGLRDMQWLHNARGRMVRKLQKEAKALRAEAMIEARREVMSQPVYRAWDFLTRKLTADDKGQAPKADPENVDPQRDSLFAAIAKLGGIPKDFAVKEWGIDPKSKPQSGVFGKPVWRITEGEPADLMAERLARLGYLEADEHGKLDLAEFYDRFSRELSGEAQYSSSYDYEGENRDVANPAGLQAGRLDADSLPAEVVEILAARRMTAKGGLDPDLVADLFEFSSGDELVRALASVPAPKDAINALTDAKLLERNGELATPEAIEREADRAIHNEARARMVATELNALAKAAGKPKVMASAAREFAAQMIARLKVRDIRPGQYANAEVRAAKAAEAAVKAGNLAEAAAEKRNHLVNLYATRAAHDAQDDVAAALRYLKKFDKRSKSLDPAYQDQIEALLERFDLRPASLKALDRRASFAEWLAAQREAGIEPDVPEGLENEANRTHYKNLTVEEFRGLVDTIKQIEHLGRLKHKLLTAQDKREFKAIVEEVAGSIVENGGTERPVELEEPGRFKQFVENFRAGHRKLASLVRQMDGGKDAGPFWRVFVRGMNEAGTREASMVEDATVRLMEIYKPMLALKGGLNGDKRFIKAINASLTRAGRLSVALNWGNETNRLRVMEGDGWTEYQVQAILNTLTRAEWQFVQDVWAFIDSYWPQIEAKEKRVTGRAPDKVKALPFTVMVDGENVSLSGGYYPIKYDSNRDDRAEKHEAAEIAEEMKRGAYTRASTKRGHTKARTESVKRPVRKTLDVITQHVGEVTHDLAWHEWLIDANRLLDAKPINQAIRTHYGTAVIRTMKDALTGIAAGDMGRQTALDTALLYLRANVSRSTMGFSLTTAFLQPFGLLQSVVRIGAKPVMHGIGRWAGDIARMENTLKWVGEKSEFMRLRAKTFNRELHEIRNRVSHGHSKIRTVYDASLFMLMQKMQMVADIPTWIGAYDKALAEGVEDADAVALADQAVLDSQGGGQNKDMAELQRKHPMLTMFYSYFNTTLNLAAESTAQTNFKNPLAVAGWLSDMMLLMVVPALGPAMILAMMRGEACWEEGDCAREMAQAQLGYTLGTVVGVRELSGMAEGYDYAGPPVGRVVADLGKFATQVSQGEADEAAVMSAVRLFGAALGVPTTQILRSWRGWNAWAEGDAPATSILLGPPPKD